MRVHALLLAAVPLVALAADPAPPSPDAIVVALGPPQIDHAHSGMVISKPTSEGCEKMFEDLPQQVGRTGVLCHRVRLKRTEYPFALDLERQELGVDVDRDGAIAASEWLSLVEDGAHLATDATLIRPMKDGSTMPVRVGLRWNPDQEWLGLVGTTRKADAPLPGGTVQVATSETSGVWSKWSALGIDLDRDGVISGSNRLEEGRNERVVGIDGTFWQVSVAPSGETMTFSPVPRPDGLLAKGAPAPDFELADVQGEVRSLATYRGRWLVMDFWGTWCGPCRAEMPELVKWEATQPDDVAVLGMAGDEPGALKAYLKKEGHPWPDIPIEQSGPTAKAYRVNAWPTYVLVDPDGALVAIGTLEHVTGSLEAARKERG